MVRAVRRRGEPLIVLGAIVVCWVGARVALWPGEDYAAVAAAPMAELLTGASEPEAALKMAAALRPAETFAGPAPRPAARLVTVVHSQLEPLMPVPFGPQPISPQVAPAVPPVAPGLAGGHAMLWLAAVSRMPGPAALLAAADRLGQLPPAVPPGRPAERRWSADAWALVRSGGGAASIGPSAATYGGSQVGAVLRYRLVPGSAHRPAAYLRASAALNGSGEQEAALGFSARPIADLPVVLAAEGRVGRFSGRTVVRPAAMAVTELPPITLPHGARAELYLQGGYVGGAGATPFIDGQLRLDRQVARVGPVELRAGAGAWGGAQRGAARLDVGPTATLGIAQGTAGARVGLDWRFRIEGSAAPASGPALTISAGF